MLGLAKNKGKSMLTISVEQLQSLEAIRLRRARAYLLNLLGEDYPVLAANLNVQDREAVVNQWIAQAEKYEIFEIENVSMLVDLRYRWGDFSEPLSGWILDVLKGPLTEEEKIAFITDVIDGE
jgi:hypothetical protein